MQPHQTLTNAKRHQRTQHLVLSEIQVSSQHGRRVSSLHAAGVTYGPVDDPRQPRIRQRQYNPIPRAAFRYLGHGGVHSHKVAQGGEQNIYGENGINKAYFWGLVRFKQ